MPAYFLGIEGGQRFNPPSAHHLQIAPSASDFKSSRAYWRSETEALCDGGVSERGCVFEHAGSIALQPLRFPTIGRASPASPLPHPGFHRICVRGASPQTTENADEKDTHDIRARLERRPLARHPRAEIRLVSGFSMAKASRRENMTARVAGRDGKLYKRRELGPKQSVPAVRRRWSRCIP